MKKAVLLSLVLCVLLNTVRGDGFDGSRYDWWKIRLKKLNDLKENYSKKPGTDRRILGLLDADINRSTGMIALYDTQSRNNGSLSQSETVVTAADIDRELARVLTPLFSLHYLEILVNGLASGGNTASAAESAVIIIEDLASKKFGRDAKDFARLTVEQEISREELGRMSSELYLGKVMLSRREIIDSSRAGLAAELNTALAGRKMNACELEKKIIEAVSAHFSRANLSGRILHDREALEASPVFRKIFAKLSKDFDGCAGMIALLDGHSVYLLERIRYFYNFPAEFDRVLFTGRRVGALLDKKQGAGADAEKKSDSAEIEFQQAVSAIDDLRKKAVVSVTGREKKEYYDDLTARFGRIIGRYEKAVKDQIGLLEKKIPGEKRSDGDGRKIFLLKDACGAKTSCLRDYAKLSHDFIKLAADSRVVETGTMLGQLSYQLEKEKEFLGFFGELARDAAGVASFDNPGLHMRYVLAMGKSGAVYKMAPEQHPVDRKEAPFLTRTQSIKVKDLKAQHGRETASIRNKIRKQQDQFLKTKTANAAKHRSANASLKDSVALHEISLLQKSAEEYAGLFDVMRYAEELFARYSLKYDEFLKEAQAGTASAELLSCIRAKSVYPQIEGFDRDRFKKESAAKKFLREEGEAAFSTLVSAISMYRRRGIEPGGFPSADEIVKLHEPFGRKVAAKISDWLMTETNFDETDRKAALKLSQVLNRRLWNERSGISSRTDGTANYVRIEDLKISMDIPRGWEEKNPGDKDRQYGLLKSFASLDSDSSISLVKIPLGEKNAKDISEEWLKKSGTTLVNKKWGKTGALEYFWILSKDSGKNVYELYAISRNGFALIISGRTTGNKYRFFKDKLDAVISSLRNG